MNLSPAVAAAFDAAPMPAKTGMQKLRKWGCKSCGNGDAKAAEMGMQKLRKLILQVAADLPEIGEVTKHCVGGSPPM